MLCREGIVSLIAFIGSIIGFLTPAFSLLFIFDIALDSILNGALYVGGVLSLYVIICFVSYISNTEADHEVSLLKIELLRIKATIWSKTNEHSITCRS